MTCTTATSAPGATVDTTIFTQRPRPVLRRRQPRLESAGDPRGQRTRRLVLGHAAGLLALLALALAAWPSAARAQQWIEHRPAGAGYRVELPGTPTPMTQDIQTPGGPAKYHAAAVVRGDRGFLATHTAYKPGSISADPQVTLDGVRDGQLQGSALRDEKRVTVDGAPGRRILFDKGGQVVSTLIVLSDHVLYQMIFMGPKGSETSPDVQRFMSSFALVGR